MANVMDLDLPGGVIDLVDDTILADSKAMKSFGP